MQTIKKIIAEKVLEGVCKINPAAELTAERKTGTLTAAEGREGTACRFLVKPHFGES